MKSCDWKKIKNGSPRLARLESTPSPDKRVTVREHDRRLETSWEMIGVDMASSLFTRLSVYNSFD
ncbi:hypothetical protein RchiOBHm_Chr4g0438601 [Rosa chinensis]|uniref:Uncharacterized protein n=1 Tax=Rosa chinensis TaxID=74649 RepID=A0A2P6R2K0_ROSCH|nr:hypothetical protein RchiOBHm_Chr4g0438601 [Rosa chinensis]